MNILMHLDQIYGSIVNYTLIYIRLFAFMSTFIIFRRDYVTPRITITLTAILSLFVLTSIGDSIRMEAFSLQYFLMAITQSIIGLLSGIIINIVFDTFIGLGQFSSVQIGISIASQFDPKFGSVTTLTHFYLILALVIFFSLNGHLLALSATVNSFSALPVSIMMFDLSVLKIAKYASVIFSGTVSMSITLLVVIFLCNITLAIMTKFAPQFNIFSIGINMSLIIGLFCIYFTYQYVVDHSREILTHSLQFFSSQLSGALIHVR